MNEELFLFYAKNSRRQQSTYMVKSKEEAQEVLDLKKFSDEKYVLCRLVPVSLAEETVTTVKKVIP